MNTEITKKQAILLIVLGAILIVVCFVQFLLRPVLSDIKEAKEQVVTLTEEYENLVQQSNSYDQNIKALEGWNEKNSEDTRRLYPLCEPQRIDNILTRVVGMFGADVVSLSITDLNQYYLDAENNLIIANPELVEAAEEGTAPEDMQASAYTATGEYRRDFVYTVEGNYEDMTELLNFVNNVTFFGISDFTFASLDENNERILKDEYRFTITVTAYMYKNPLDELEPITEEEFAEAADKAAS